MKTASIKSPMWTDSWFQKLNQKEKLLWIYIISNERANTLGIYDISLMTMAFESGLSEQECLAAFKTFSENRKAYYEYDYVIVANRIKFNSKSPKIAEGNKEILSEIPNTVIAFVLETNTRISKILRDTYRVSIQYKTAKNTVSSLILDNSIIDNSISSNPIQVPEIPDDEWDERFSAIMEDIEDDYGLSNIDVNKLRAIAEDKPGRAAISDLYLAIQANKKVKKKGAYLMKSLFSIKNGVQK